MTIQAVEAISSGLSVGTPAPWVGGQLPSPWTAGAGQQNQIVAPTSFAQALEQARGAVAATSSSMSSGATGVQPATSASPDGGVSKKMGFSALEDMGSRLSEADAKVYRSVQSLTNLDVTSPNMHAEFLSVGLMATKAGLSTTLAMKFSSKINESINTLLKTS